MTVEATLTRKLGITFIDARAITTEAKLNLGLHSYPDERQRSLLVEEACKIFYDTYPEDVRLTMQADKQSLDASIVIPSDSIGSRNGGPLPAVGGGASSGSLPSGSTRSASSFFHSGLSDHRSSPFSLGGSGQLYAGLYVQYGLYA